MASMSAYVSRQTEGGTEGPLQLKECVQQREGPLQLKESVQQREGPLQLKELIFSFVLNNSTSLHEHLGLGAWIDATKKKDFKIALLIDSTSLVPSQ